MTRIVAATCLAQPHLQDHDAPLAAALARRGVTLTPAPWNGPQTPFDQGDPIILRSTWDYPHTPQAFDAWLTGLSDRPYVYNPPALMRWNLSKRYLLGLQAALPGKDIVIPPTAMTEPSTTAITAALQELGLDRAVVKPLISASAIGLTEVSLAAPDTIEIAAARLQADGLNGEGLVQALVPDVTTAGETSFVFIDGDFTHAFRKTPKDGDIRCQEEYGGVFTRIDPPAWALAGAKSVLTCLPGGSINPPLYARIDAILLGAESAERLDGRMALMEVELIEPELCFHLAPEAADRLADSLSAVLKHET